MSDEASIIVKQHKDGLNYQKQMQFNTKWPEYDRFKSGDQWPAATDKTKNLPRPVINIIKFILNHKISSVMNENIKMVFNPQEVPAPNEEIKDEQLKLAVEGAEKFTRYSETTWEEIQQDKLNEDALDDASTTGTCIWHYYWDNSRKGGITQKYIGEMCGEVIDPINWFPGNPQCKDAQKQPYHIITSREMLSTIKDKAKKNKLPIEKIEMIQSDSETQDEGYDSAKTELSGSEKVTLITKYWKENGKVYYSQVASNVEITPKTDTGLSLYPIAVMQWEKRKKSIFGVSEVEGIIPNQKSVNFILAMMLLSVQETAWPKILAKAGALNQQIYNIPGEIVYDNYDGQGDGIKFMQPGNISQAAPLVLDKLFELTRNISGANEVATGEPFTKDLNAAAIIAMQRAAAIPIELIKKRFFRAMEDIGRIWEDFWKIKYNLDRRVPIKNADGEEETMDFNGTTYKDIPLRLKIDIGASSNFSESLMMASLDKFYANKDITFEQYLRYAPKNVVPFRDRLLKEIEQIKEDQAQPPNIEELIKSLTPEEQAEFMNMTPEQQQAVMQQMTA